MEGLQIVETEKKKPSAIYGGYQYRIHRTNKENIISWACILEKTQICKGRLLTKDNEVLRASEHACKPDVAIIEVRKQVFNAKKRAREEDQPVSKIYREELGQLFNRGYDFIVDVPQYSSIKSTLYRARQIVQGSATEPKNANAIVLPDDVLRMDDGFNFLLLDDGQKDRILAFASKKGIEVLRTCKVYFMDGTFKSCSKQFAEIYTIHADVGSTNDEVNVIPVVFALLPDKKRKTYDRFFSLLKNRVTDWNPEVVILDFEMAVIQSLQSLFVLVKICGCNFHFNQCLWRKIQEVGFVNEYKNNEDIRLHVRMCAALAFLPRERIDDGWLCIQEDTPTNAKLEEFYNYFVDQWLENPAINVDIWNCHEKCHRTNNIVEGWHHKLNLTLRKPHPKCVELISCFKSEASTSDFVYDRMQLNLEGKKRRKKTLKLDGRITRTMSSFHITGDIRKCLKSLAYIQKLE